MEKIMKSGRKAHRVYPALGASVLAIGLVACDQIASLWKSEKETGPVSQVQLAPRPTEEKTEPIRPVAAAKPAQAAKVDEDKALAARVKSALGSDPRLKLLAIDAGSSSGVVTLYGTADSRAHREQAAQVAADVPGVTSVRNELVIVAGS
jgi:hyperosmotically inducible protein